jgi:alpha-amylase
MLFRGRNVVVVMQYCSLVLSFGLWQPPSADEWKHRNIFQILTDRWYDPTGQNKPCRIDASGAEKDRDALWRFCGGTFAGIADSLDDLQELGYDAIWISPIVENMGTDAEDGYHGYWAKDFYTIAPQFGGREGLLKLKNELHKRNMYLMVDIVANHAIACESNDFQSSDLDEGKPCPLLNQVTPFNDQKYYHEYQQIVGNYPVLPDGAIPCGMEITMPDGNTWCETDKLIETGWMFTLADLNETNPETKEILFAWIKDLVQEYEIDGLRLDSTQYMSQFFWKDFMVASGIDYAVGEITSPQVGYCARTSQITNGRLNTLNYPLFYRIREIMGFRSWWNDAQQKTVYQKAPMELLGVLWHQGISNKNSTHTYADPFGLGNFLENHDQIKFLYECYHSSHATGLTFSKEQCLRKLRSAVALIQFWPGVPINYYSTDVLWDLLPSQALVDHDRYALADVFARLPMWNSPNALKSDRRLRGQKDGEVTTFREFMKRVTSTRKKKQIGTTDFEQVFSSETVFCWRRMNPVSKETVLLACLNNAEHNDESPTAIIDLDRVGPPIQSDTLALCNIFESTTCLPKTTSTARQHSLVLPSSEPIVFAVTEQPVDPSWSVLFQ